MLLEVVDHQAYLGITITENLNWKMHVLNVKNKANKTLGFIKRNLHSCPERIKAQAYISLVRPSLEYACVSWDLYRKYQIDMLERVQGRAARFVVVVVVVVFISSQDKKYISYVTNILKNITHVAKLYLKIKRLM